MITPRPAFPKKRLLGSLLALTFVVLGKSQTVTTLYENGPKSERINIVVVAEGYTASELPAFVPKARELVDHLLSEDPFLSYKSLFNAYAIAVESAESGADIPSQDIEVDTAFDATFGSANIERLLTVRTSKVYNLLNQTIPEYDIPLVIVNSSKYGGSGGNISVVSTNSNAKEIAAHEIGHSFGRLADEYETAGGSPRERANATASTNREDIVWNHWIDTSTPLPTPETNNWANTIGLFEGAVYRSEGWYRPHFNSKMRSLGKPWGPVNQEQLTLRIFERIELLSSPSPTETNLEPASPQSLQFSVTRELPNSQIQWTLNDEIQSSADEAYALDIATLPPGTHTVRVRVFEDTDLVREDPNNSLSESHSWTVTIASDSSAFSTWIQFKLSQYPDQQKPNDDPDRDQIPNLLEFYLGTDPAAPDMQDRLGGGFEDGRLYITVKPSSNTLQLNATVEASETLAAWDSIAQSSNNNAFESVDPELPIEIVFENGEFKIYDIQKVGIESLRSLRLKLELPQSSE